MEKVKAWDKKTLITELTQGKDCVNKLKNQFDPLASPEECDLLLEKILSSLDKSLSILNWKVFNGTSDPFSCCSTISVPGNGTSLKTEGSDLEYLRDQGQNKKRKMLQPWSKQVRVSGTELESFNHDDGYSWRKYGQKYILGANHPRAYYRCTHRKQGCFATKQVQKSDEDPLVFEVTYKGKHTCKASQSSRFISYENQKKYCDKNQCQLKKQKVGNQKVEKLNIKEEAFPFTPLKCESENAQIFSNSIEPFISPITSESMYLSLLPNQEEEFEMGKILQSSESNRIEFISTPTSVIHSPFCSDWDLSMDGELDIRDPNLMIDISEYFT
ncbi:probable WRKY transcription factor 53 [Lycium barbarum]|uniref:probable WRKY transcription factor 53 n=1 Tax=Lycium barbarum TaxID=112863 RepID=UPI00293E9627|nr:probable WRKY transcription factor 53 [Lycium barbarum]